MALFRWVASSQIRAGDEAEAKWYIIEQLKKPDFPGSSPIEGPIVVKVTEIEEE